jgi:Holliday junction DNA helicase RuvA
MISYLRGRIFLKKEKFIILINRGIGYKVFLSQKNLSELPEIGEKLRLFCFLNVRENALDLYGFLNFEELQLFEMFVEIPGIGPKAALELSSFGSLEKIKELIEKEGEEVLAKISGIGKKKARKIILELSGKIKDLEKKTLIEKPEKEEALEALVSLGFSKIKAKEVLSQVPKEIKDTEKRIKEALKILGK